MDALGTEGPESCQNLRKTHSFGQSNESRLLLLLPVINEDLRQPYVSKHLNES